MSIASKRPNANPDVAWHVAMRPGKRKLLDKSTPLGAIAEKIKASIRAKVEHPFRVIKRQFGFTKVRYRGLKKNTAEVRLHGARQAESDHVGGRERDEG